MEFPPNAEQKQILRAAKGARAMKVIAGAGTGKTTTLAMLAETLAPARVRYTAFNRAAKEDAQSRFPQNVKCYTTHGMAYATHGSRYQQRMRGGRVPAWKSAKILGVSDMTVQVCLNCNATPAHDCRDLGHAIQSESLTAAQIAVLATRSVTRFCYSDEDALAPHHVPLMKGMDKRSMPAIRDAIFPIAQLAWNDMIKVDGRGGQLQFSHDIYLKLFQLSDPTLREQVILLDEAQDTNPCVGAIMLRQQDKGKRVIFVGDPNQAIYEWRGARDFLARLDTDNVQYLQGSYRFGPDLADDANMWLEALGSDLRLKGWKKLNTTVQYDNLTSPSAILSRSNAGCIAGAFAGLASGETVAITGGSREIEQLARDAQNLMSGRKVTNEDLMAFDDWEAVRTYVKEEPEEAGSLGPLVRAVDEYGPDGILDMCSRLVDEKTGQPTLTVSTMHKAKGKEFDHVQISDDSRQPDDPSDLSNWPKEELRLAYVAVTRARKSLSRGGLGWLARSRGHVDPPSSRDAYDDAAALVAGGILDRSEEEQILAGLTPAQPE